MENKKKNNKVPILASEASRLSKALRKAAQNGAPELVKSLLAQGADAQWQGMELKKERALMLAARAGHEACVRVLAPLSDKTAAEHFGYTALMLAAEGGHEGCVKALLEGSPLNKCCRQDGFTAMGLALMEGHVRVAQILLDAGASLAERIKGGESLACEIMANGTEPEIAKALEWIIEKGGPHFAKTQDSLGRSPLHWALLRCDEDCARLLLNHADLAIRDVAGRTALSFCIDVEPPERAARLARLISPGSDGASIDHEGLTPLMRAARRGAPELVEVLCGAESLGVRDKAGRSALDWAEAGNHTKAAEVLRVRLLAQSEHVELSGAVGRSSEMKDSGPRL